MIVLDDAPANPSQTRATIPANTQISKQRRLYQRHTLHVVENHAQRGAPSDGKLAARHADFQKSASDELVIARSRSVSATDEKTRALARHRNIATTVVVALAIGALIGIYWSASEQHDSSQPAAKASNDVQPAARQQAPQETTIEPAFPAAPTLEAANPTTNPTTNTATNTTTNTATNTTTNTATNTATNRQPVLPTTNPIVRELKLARQLANDYLEEIDWLQSQNSMLRQTINSLDSETTVLNSELLQLELKVTALEADAKL